MLFVLVIVPFVFAILLVIFGKYLGKYSGYIAAFIPVLIFIWFLKEIPAVVSGNGTSFFVPWLGSFGVNLSFQVNGLSLLFSVLITGVGILVYWYSIGYMENSNRLVSYYVNLLIFTGAMLGAVLSRNLILTFMFWELTTFSSFLLIGYFDYRERSRYGAQKALFITVAGGFALFSAFVLIGHICGSFEMSHIIANKHLLLSSPLYTAIVILVLLGAFTKSAQIPFHIWLPDAMEAPTPISCYLHSATMVKLGIFLLMLMNIPLGGTAIWYIALSTIGLFSLVWGAGRALMQTDLKAILAFHTVSQLGLVIALVGYGTRAAAIGAVFHLINHSIFKGSLFLVAGMVDHTTGSRDFRFVHGLSKAMPITSVIAFCGAFAMAGVPPFNGFLSKEMLFENSLAVMHGNLGMFGSFAAIFPVLAVAGCIFTFLDCMMIVFKYFYGGPLTDKAPKHPHEPAKMMLIPSVILASGTVLAALFANPLAKVLMLPAADAITGYAVASGTSGGINISFWHGFNIPLLMTVITYTIGILFYLNLKKIVTLLKRVPVILSWNRIYDGIIFKNGLTNIADRLTNIYMTRRLQNYLQFTCIAFILITGAMMVFKGAFALDFSDLAPINTFEIIWIVAIIAAAITVVVSKKRVVALLSLGVVGYSVAFFFVLFSAPDLALTQLVVETVLIVLFIMAFKYLPRKTSDIPASGPRKVVKSIISLAMGAVVTSIALIGHSNNFFNTISNFYIENAQTLGGGLNVVNVILVDFRGLDTMGEITVIAIAAIGVFTLISLTVREKNVAKKYKGGEIMVNNDTEYKKFPETEFTQEQHKLFITQDYMSSRKKLSSNLIIHTVLRPLTFIISIFTFYLLWSGHNAPGGGFVAGLTTSACIVLLYVNYGSSFINKKLTIDFKYLIAIGLSCSLSCGLISLVFGYPFLTQAFGQIHFPVLGLVHFSTALFFDIGVYLVVTGGCLTIITSIGRSGDGIYLIADDGVITILNSFDKKEQNEWK